MLQNLGDIQGGMEVFGLDGERIGMVTDVWLSRRDPDTPDIREPVTVSLPHDGAPNAHGERDGAQRPAAGPSAVGLSEREDHAEIAPTSASTSYFKVEGAGGAYYIPFQAVTSSFPGQSVTIDCLRQECAARYARPPR